MVIRPQEHNGGVIIDKPPHNMTVHSCTPQQTDNPSELSILDLYHFLQVWTVWLSILNQSDQHPALGSPGKCCDISDTITVWDVLCDRTSTTNIYVEI